MAGVLWLPPQIWTFPVPPPITTLRSVTSNSMADQAQARMLSAAFPTPPPYYKHFTKQNVTKVRQIRKEAATNTNQIDVDSLPAELRYLIPPEPPADGRYKSFGAQHDVRICWLYV